MRRELAIVAVLSFALVVLAGPVAAQPSEPGSLRATPGDGHVDLSWNRPAGVSGSVGYRIYRGTRPDRKTELGATGGETVFRDRQAENGVTYYYHVTAFNSRGEGSPSGTVNATPSLPRTPPSVPVLFEVNRFRNRDEAELNWRTPRKSGGAEIEEYRVYRGTTPNQDALLTTTSRSSYRDTEIHQNRIYYYRVTAVNSYGESESTEKVIFTVSNRDTPPWAPTNLRASKSGTNVTLSWTAPRNGGPQITRYRVYRRTGGRERQRIETTSRTEYTDRDLERGRNYTYSVSAVNEVGEGIISREVTVRFAVQERVPSAPAALQVSGTQAGARLSWNAPQDTGNSRITGYRIYRDTGDGFRRIARASGTNFTDVTVSEGVTYRYRVAAINGVGTGPPSAVATYTVAQDGDGSDGEGDGGGGDGGSGDQADDGGDGGGGNGLPGFTVTATVLAVLVTVLARAWNKR